MGIISPVGANIGSTGGAPLYALGTIAHSNDGKEYVYVKAGTGGVTGAGFVVTIDPSYVADLLSTSNDARGNDVGVAVGAIAASEYGWVQRKGFADVQVLASAAANTRLNTTATAGALDDDGTAGAFEVSGVHLTTARAASQGNAPAFLNYPVVGASI